MGHAPRRGEFWGITRSGQRVTFTSMEFNRLVGGEVAKHLVELDPLGLPRQLGAIPAPGTVEG